MSRRLRRVAATSGGPKIWKAVHNLSAGGMVVAGLANPWVELSTSARPTAGNPDVSPGVFCLAGWFYAPASQTTQYTLFRFGATNFMQAFVTGASQYQAQIYSRPPIPPAFSGVTYGVGIPKDEWYHICYQNLGTSVQYNIYINGVYAGVTSVANITMYSAGLLRIGYNIDGLQQLTGRMASMGAWYNAAAASITPANIASLASSPLYDPRNISTPTSYLHIQPE